MSSINTLRLARPAILENLASYFHTNLSKYISIEEKNFFDKRVTEYKTGSGLEWD